MSQDEPDVTGRFRKDEPDFDWSRIVITIRDGVLESGTYFYTQESCYDFYKKSLDHKI